jgi:Zn-dependent membrane protease YugP
MIHLLFPTARELINYYKTERNKIQRQYGEIGTQRALTGREIVERYINNVDSRVRLRCKPQGKEGSEYDCNTKEVFLERRKYENSDLFAVGIAAHECGHAHHHLKHKLNYWVLRVGALTSQINFMIFIYLFGYIELNNIKNSSQGLLLCSLISLVYLLLFISRPLNNFCKLETERKASQYGIDFLIENGLVLKYEIEGIKQILRRSLLSYKVGRIKSDLSFYSMCFLSFIFLLIYFTIR